MRLLRTTYARVLALQMLTLLMMLFASALCAIWFLSATSLPIAKQAYAQLRAADALLNNATVDSDSSQAAKAALTSLTSDGLIQARHAACRAKQYAVFFRQASP